MNALGAVPASPAALSAPAAATAAGTSADGAPDRLRKTAASLEGVFVEQLFKAMRETVPQEGAVGTGSGEEIFTSLFDQKLAEEAPAQWNRGLGAAIVRALGRRTGNMAAAAAPTPMPPSGGPGAGVVSPHGPTPEHR